MYRWIIAGTAMTVLGTVWGTSVGAFGVFVSPLSEDMHWSRTGISLAASINTMAAFVCGVFWGWLADRWSLKGVLAITGLFAGLGLFLAGSADALWHFYIFYGLVAGIGLGGTAGPLTAIAVRWFPDKTGMVMGIVYAGFGGAAAVMPILVERLIAFNGWRFGLRAVSLLVGATFAGGAILLKDPPFGYSSSTISKGLKPEEIEHSAGEHSVSGPYGLNAPNLGEAVLTRPFWTLFIMMMAGDLTFFMILLHLVPRVTDTGISSATAVTVLTVSGVVGMVSTIIGGVLVDRLGARAVYAGSLCLLALSLIWLIMSTNLVMFYVFALVFGMGNGGAAPPMPALTSNIFGTQNMGSIYAAILMGSGVGGVIGPLAAGYVFDTTGSYSLALALAAGIAFAAALLAGSLSNRRQGHIPVTP